MYRDSHKIDRPIAPSDFEAVHDTLEHLEAERLREMGYTGDAKKPWEQAIRKENETKPRQQKSDFD
ncbi:MAG: hypothetical protein HC828_12680 [Blastochloris sp.]|nr:hypothetical protein [Blastochloris sp.]